MYKLLTIVGARPQIIKSAALNRAVKTKYSDKFQEIIVHTGQHYDQNMSEVFFSEMGISPADYNLNVGSDSHAKQSAKMLAGIEELLIKEKVDAIVLYGDTNSTMAGAIAASKISVPVMHIEAGLRSYEKAMPEEINRILCDHCSTLLFSPTPTGVKNLAKEGFDIEAKKPYGINNPKVYHCGDVMYDNSLFFAKIAEEKANVFESYNFKKGAFILATVHRANNTDDPQRLTAIVEAFIQIAATENIVFPLHPRTQKLLQQNVSESLYTQFTQHNNIYLIPPQSFLNITALEQNCKLIISDSGGLQKEAFFFKKPCVILRPQSEWVEIIENGNAVLADVNVEKIISSVNTYLTSSQKLTYPPIFGNGKAAEFILDKIWEYLEG